MLASVLLSRRAGLERCSGVEQPELAPAGRTAFVLKLRAFESAPELVGRSCLELGCRAGLYSSSTSAESVVGVVLFGRGSVWDGANCTDALFCRFYSCRPCSGRIGPFARSALKLFFVCISVGRLVYAWCFGAAVISCLFLVMGILTVGEARVDGHACCLKTKMNVNCTS